MVKLIILLKSIEKWSKKLSKETKLLVGGLDYSLDKNGLPLQIKNVIYEISKDGLKSIYTKQLLPNYDIFDEEVFLRPYNGKLIRAVDYEMSRGCIYSCSYCVETIIQKYYSFTELIKV